MLCEYLLLPLPVFIYCLVHRDGAPSVSVLLSKAGGAFAVVYAFIAFYRGVLGLMVLDTTPVKFPLGVLLAPKNPR